MKNTELKNEAFGSMLKNKLANLGTIQDFKLGCWYIDLEKPNTSTDRLKAIKADAEQDKFFTSSQRDDINILVNLRLKNSLAEVTSINPVTESFPSEEGLQLIQGSVTVNQIPSVDGVELSEDDIIAVKLARLRRPLSQHLREVVTTGIPFIPSEIHIAGADYVALCEEYGFDGEDFLIGSIIPSCVSMIMMMNDRAPVETVQSMVEQLDSARDAWLASQIRNLQEKAEEPEVIAGETEQARQANKTTRPRSAKK